MCYYICNAVLSNRILFNQLILIVRRIHVNPSIAIRLNMKMLILSSTWECTLERVHINVTTGVRTSQIKPHKKPIKMYTLVKIHTHVPNMIRVTYKIAFILSIWGNTWEKSYECIYCGKNFDQKLNQIYFEKLISDFKTF